MYPNLPYILGSLEEEIEDYTTNLYAKVESHVGVTHTGPPYYLVSNWQETINGRDLSQAVEANQPQLEANHLNGYPALFCDINRGLYQPIYMDNAALSLNQPFTLFALMKKVAEGQYGYAAAIDSILEPRIFFGTGNDVLQSKLEVYAGVELIADNADNNDILLTAVVNGANSKVYRNGVLLTTGDAGAGGTNGWRIFNSQFLNVQLWGYLTQLRIYNAALTDGNVLQVWNFIKNMYGLD